MEAILSPLRPLSMTTAKRSPPSAVAERPSLTKVSAVKHAPPCETMDHTRPFQLSLVSRWRCPRLLPEKRPGRMLRIRLENQSRRRLSEALLGAVAHSSHLADCVNLSAKAMRLRFAHP